MSIRKIKPSKGIRKEFTVPGDKSISHRSIILGSIATGTTAVRNFLNGEDCMATIYCFKEMGVDISLDRELVLIKGKGLHGLSEPKSILETGNSGTTTRLLAGLLSGQNFTSILSGDTSLNRRPMNRIIDPLTEMGANIRSIKNNGCAPLEIAPAPLRGIDYLSPVASAQVKSAVLLAALYADAATTVTEPALSRNHTELMMSAFGADITTKVLDNKMASVTLTPGNELNATDIEVPGDISSAAYLIAAGLLIPDSEILIKNVGINPTRDGFLTVVKDMGGDITLLNERVSGGEPIADILVKSSALNAVTIEGSLIPSLIDEIPIIAVMAAVANGTTVIKDAAELTVKETNRIETISDNLKRMGADITPTDDGMIIVGSEEPLKGAKIDSHYDHRIAMAFTIAALIAKGDTEIKESQCVDVSFPDFYTLFE